MEVKEKILTDVGAYHDVVSDLRDILGDLNGILDVQDKRENDILVGFKGILGGFEEYVFESINMIEEEL